jgi:GxxExxY protein
MGLEYEALTEKIIACAIAVHRELGPGFLESIYENALCVELKTQQIPFQRQLRVPVAYRSVEVGLHRLDLLGVQIFLSTTIRPQDSLFATFLKKTS